MLLYILYSRTSVQFLTVNESVQCYHNNNLSSISSHYICLILILHYKQILFDLKAYTIFSAMFIPNIWCPIKHSTQISAFLVFLVYVKNWNTSCQVQNTGHYVPFVNWSRDKRTWYITDFFIRIHYS